MKLEVKNWWEQAESDLNAAKNSISTKSFDWACFQAQQAVEKGLKSIYLKKFNVIRKVHDLFFLGEKLELPSDILDKCIKLNKVYVETRYPDAGDVIPAKKFSKEDAAAFVNLAEEILSWLKKKL